MVRRKTIFACSVLWGALIAAACASPAESAVQARRIYGPGWSQGYDSGPTHHSVLPSDQQRTYRLVQRPIAEPAAVVGRALSEQPAFRHLVELVVVHTRVLFDPEADYYRQGHNPLDDGHHLLAAQRLHRSLTTHGAYTVRGRRAHKRAASSDVITPKLIIIKPGDEQWRRPRPVPPASPRSKHLQVAAAE